MPGKRRKTSSSRRRRRSTVGAPSRRKTRSAQKKFQLPKPKRSTVKALSNLLETKKTVGVIPDAAYPTPATGWITNEMGYQLRLDHTLKYNFLHVDSFNIMSYSTDVAAQSSQTNIDRLAGQCLEGDSLFAKYLAMKVQVDYPEGAHAPQTAPRPVEVIWGWVNPLNLTSYTTPTSKTITPEQVRAHIENHVKEEFDQKQDNMRFHDKKKRNYNIIGRRKVTPNFNRQVPTLTTYLASAGPIQFTIKWPMMKKVNYQKSERSPWANDIGKTFAYPNEAYLPFVVVYNPDSELFANSDEGKVMVKYNSCLWFNDA